MLEDTSSDAVLGALGRDELVIVVTAEEDRAGFGGAGEDECNSSPALRLLVELLVVESDMMEGKFKRRQGRR